MATRSRISPRFLLKKVAAALSDDRTTSYQFARYQVTKETFNWRHPRGAKHGRGDAVQLIGLRITDMCNLRCHTCGQWGDKGYLRDQSLKELKQREVPVKVYKRLVDQVVDAGWSPIWYLWGGEPMLYPGLLDLMHYINERGMPVSMVSNGTHIAEHAEEILETCQLLFLSVDGPNAEIHNRQRPGVSQAHDNFKDVERTLQVLHTAKQEQHRAYPFVVPLSCVSTYNIDALVDLHQFVSPYADAHILYLTWWIDPTSAQAHSKDFERRFGFSPKTHYGWIGTWKDFDHGAVSAQIEEMQRLSKQNQRCPPMIMPDLRTHEDISRYYKDHTATFGYDQCISIYMTMEINSNGDVGLCRDYHDYVIGNIKTDAITDIWNGPTARTFRKSISTEGSMPACRRCCGLMGF